jgi:hypothetical protein
LKQLIPHIGELHSMLSKVSHTQPPVTLCAAYIGVLPAAEQREDSIKLLDMVEDVWFSLPYESQHVMRWLSPIRLSLLYLRPHPLHLVHEGFDSEVQLAEQPFNAILLISHPMSASPAVRRPGMVGSKFCPTVPEKSPYIAAVPVTTASMCA